MIPIYEPYLPKHVLKHAHNALDSKWISSHGKYIEKTEELLREINQCKHVILTNNGTSATHLVSIGLQHKHPQLKTLLVPNSVYVAAWNSFKMSEDFDFRLLPVNSDTWNAEYEKAIDLEINLKDFVQSLDHAREIGVLVVHNIGNIVNVPALKKLFDDDRVIFVEDNCEGFLGSYEGVPTGSESLLSSVSFFGNKTLTSGEGGALFTDDDDLYSHLNSVKNQGHASKNYVFDKLGYNYRMTNVQAAILFGQLSCASEIIDRKKTIFELYRKYLSSVDEVKLQEEESNTSHSNWMFAIKTQAKACDLQLHLYRNKVDSRSMFPPINHHDHYQHFASDPIASELHDHVIMLPSFPTMTSKDVMYICNQVKNFFK